MRRGSLRLVKNVNTRVCCSQTRLEDSSVDDDETCELVNGVELTLGEDPADRIDAYLLKAVKNNNGTGLLLLSDVFGFEDSATRDFAYRVACNGYKYVALTFLQKHLFQYYSYIIYLLLIVKLGFVIRVFEMHTLRCFFIGT
ncbi:hypothetical protein Sjap_018191 [Stephania japonica]|uniref:Uncharacterized protein n=1 Tax=Stephania japonica TaxID=461633 RepID=A0AAP0I878_9MAGN